jgi:hypothetical protein
VSSAAAGRPAQWKGRHGPRLLEACCGHVRTAVPSRRLQHSRVDAAYCCSADSGAVGTTAARGGGATLWLSAPPQRVAPLARAGCRIAVRMQRCYAAL